MSEEVKKERGWGRRALRWGKEALFFALTLFVVSWLVNLWRAPDVPETALPALPGRTLEGVPATTLLKPGRPLLLHFWGTWCPVCRQEADNLERVARHYRVLTVAVQSGDAATLAAWMRKRGLHYPVLPDPSGTLAHRFGIGVYPTSLIYDSRGRLKFVETGYTTTPGLLVRLWLAE
jgi:thiol-disulfide isomerase/thioredoxin